MPGKEVELEPYVIFLMHCCTIDEAPSLDLRGLCTVEPPEIHMLFTWEKLLPAGQQGLLTATGAGVRKFSFRRAIK